MHLRQLVPHEKAVNPDRVGLLHIDKQLVLIVKPEEYQN